MAAPVLIQLILMIILIEFGTNVASYHDYGQEHSEVLQTDYTSLQQMAAEAVPTCSPSCGPWFHCQSGRCQPGPPLPSGVLSFDNKSVLDCYCVTYNKLQHSVEIGKCIYNSMKNNIRDNIIYSKLPSNVSDLNKMFCDRFNRQGTLCGQCKDDHFPLAYSFNLTCVKCSHSKTNLIKYILVAFVPLTAFYFIILLFKVNIASSHFFGFVMYCQAITMPAQARFFFTARLEYNSLFQIVGSLYGIWNLDFFRPLDLRICLETSTLLNLTLDLLVAVYPLLLMIVTYLMIHLYDRNFKPLVMLWRPFRRVFNLFRDKWDIRSSVIDSILCHLFLTHKSQVPQCSLRSSKSCAGLPTFILWKH